MAMETRYGRSGRWEGVWLTQHLWEHYAFSGDEDFLRDKPYPIMKEAALFCLDWLIEDKDGYFITSPSTFLEQKFLVGDKCHAVRAATTMDLSRLFGIPAGVALYLGRL